MLKPLAPRGGEHVFYLRRRQVSNLNQIITTVTKDGYAVAQEYLPESRAGRKAPPAAQRRADPGRRPRRDLPPPPALGAAAAREAGGSRRGKCDFGPVEARICDILRPKLLADGLYFVGVDIVGDKILELNVFTPGRHPRRSSELYGLDVADIVIRDLERRVRLRAAYRTTFDPEAADVV